MFSNFLNSARHGNEYQLAFSRQRYFHSTFSVASLLDLKTATTTMTIQFSPQKKMSDYQNGRIFLANKLLLSRIVLCF